MSTLTKTETTPTYDIGVMKPGDEVRIECGSQQYTLSRVKDTRIMASKMCRVMIMSAVPAWLSSTVIRAKTSMNMVDRKITLGEPFNIGLRGRPNIITAPNVTAVYLNNRKVLG